MNLLIFSALILLAAAYYYSSSGEMAEFTEANRSHFHMSASTYNSRYADTIAQLIEQIQARREWIGVDWLSDDSSDDSSSTLPEKHVRVLDYACGTGLVTRALAPYATEFIGIDLAEGMVHEYNTRMANQGLSPSEMRAIQGNLIDPAVPSPSEFAAEEFFDFDIAVVGLGFHHFDDPALATRRLSQRLKKGGVLLIIDFLPHGDFGLSKDTGKTVKHHGFDRETVEKMFVDAGVGGGFDLVSLGGAVVFQAKPHDEGAEKKEGEEKHDHGHQSMKREVFMARGVKL